MAKRTLSRKGGTILAEAEARSRKSFIRFQLQFHGSILSLAATPDRSLMSRWFRLQLRLRGKWPPAPVAPTLATNIWILIICTAPL